ncbi:MAG: hypothetical protein M1833_000791 [Piccolia ochrophora]|nr:MAG: hypothetical protein M1833_000791 [Piccolia ochrophora]
MAETSAPTPGSTTESTPAKAPAPKDKECPYCHQPFTSSSLGRHLDLYVREKNPKPADGVHNVDEIRKTRCSITRRQPRNSSGRRSTSTPNRSRQSPQPGHRSPSYRTPDMPDLPVEKLRTRFNHPNWQATGVIPNLPPVPNDSLSRQDAYRDLQRRPSVKGDLQQKTKLREAVQNGRAAELALREILDSIKATVNRETKSSALDFDAFTLTFPALVLQCLSPPPTLFSTQPFPINGSWSLEPPTEMQLDAVREHVRGQFERWRKDQPKAVTNGVGDVALPKENTNGTKTPVEAEEERTMAHVEDAFTHWKVLSDNKKHEMWRLEILRSYSREKDRRKETEDLLQRTLQEADNLRAQVDRMSNLQQPREFLRSTPATISIPKDSLRELQSRLGGVIDWDYDHVVAKWKDVAQETRQNNLGLSAQRPLPATPVNAPNGTPSFGSMVNGDYAVGEDLDDVDQMLVSPGVRPPTSAATHAGATNHFVAPELQDNVGAMDVDGVPTQSSQPPKSPNAPPHQQDERGYQFVTMNGGKGEG